MNIPKVASDPNRFRRQLYAFRTAREAFKAFLQSIRINENEKVLLPAYIGWSPREGSGVFDPIRDLNLKYDFYSLDRKLDIRCEELFDKMNEQVRVLLLIHYFGRPDPNFQEIVKRAHEKGIIVIEDAAHALYTSFVDGSCGTEGDGVLYSLHKMLPFEQGGVLQVNSANLAEKLNSLTEISKYESYLRFGCEYNLSAISSKRKENEKILRGLLLPLFDSLELLWPHQTNEYSLQTLPVVIKRQSREDFYFGLNKAGFGAVSLYHTMISEIPQEYFPDSFWLSQRILNLPIHQDIGEAELVCMAEWLLSFCSNGC